MEQGDQPGEALVRAVSGPSAEQGTLLTGAEDRAGESWLGAQPMRSGLAGSIRMTGQRPDRAGAVVPVGQTPVERRKAPLGRPQGSMRAALGSPDLRRSGSQER